MRALVVYYSQTGNTRKVAKEIARGIEERGVECDLRTIRDVSPEQIGQYDLVGFGSPVWTGAEPPNMRAFILSVPKQGGKLAFCFCTHGVMPEHYFPVVVRRLTTRGFVVIGWAGWFGSVHFQIAPSPYWTEGHPDEQDLEEARAFGREMVERAWRISKGERDLIPPVPPFVYTPQLWVLAEFYRYGHNPHGRLSYDPSKCRYPKCGLCIEHCPMGYNDFSAEPRRFGSTGQGCDMWLGCTFCEMICPTGAIWCDWEAFLKESEELLSLFGFNPLEEAARKLVSEGKLRMHVPWDEVRWDRLYFMVHQKRPRFKVGGKDEG